MRKKVLAVFGVLLALALALAGTPRPVAAEPPAQGQIPNEMKVVRTFGGKQVEDPFKLMASCPNRRMSYRLMQVLERNQSSERVLRPYDLTLHAGWTFGCALSFFQTEKYREGTDQGLWLGWRFSMGSGFPKFLFMGRSRSSGERFLCSPIKEAAEDVFVVAVEWNKKLGARWRALQRNLLNAILEKDYGGREYKDLTEDEQEAAFNKLTVQMEKEWPKELKTEEEKALNEKRNRLLALLEQVLNQPKDTDYEYRVLEKGVGVPVLVQDGSLNSTGGNLELKGRNRGLTETMLFRLVQIASGLWQDKKFHADDVTVETGWNDPKVKEFLTGGLRVPEGRIVLGAAGSLTAEKDLKLADAWFRVSALSTGKSLLFRATEKMLSPLYFELKGKGASTAQEETRLAGLAQVSPFLGGFEVRDYPKDKGLDDVLYGNSLVFVGQDGSRKELQLGSLVNELMKNANVSSDVVFNAVAGFRAAQFASQAWSDGVFKPADASITVGPMLRGADPADFWKSLGVADVETSAGASDNERLTVKIKIKSTGEICTVAETEDLGRRDYANLKAYADRIRPLAKKEKKSASVDLQTFAKAGMVSAFGEVHVMHDELKGWSGALHITEDSMEELIGRATAVPNVGNFVVSKTTKDPVPPTPEAPEPGEPDKPEPETPKPETPKPETPKPETPKPETPKPETPKPETQQEQELGDFLKSPQNWGISETREGNVTKVVFTASFETSLGIKDIRLTTQGFRQGTVKAELLPVSSGKTRTAAAAAHRYTLRASGEFETADRDKAAITGIFYTPSDGSGERSLPLPSSGIPLKSMKETSPAPDTEKKSGSGGCDAGFLSFAALALVPMASRFGKKAR